MTEGMTPSEVALLDRDGGFGGAGGAFFWVFALLMLAGGNFGGWGGNRGDYVTHADLDAQTTHAQLQEIAIQTANNNYETAQLINNQTTQILQQNNTNLINAIQGFNQVNQNMQAGFSSVAQALSQLGYQMDQCCCKIQTQMLQNRLDDAQAALVAANNNISNYNQSQYILSQLGRFVAWTPSGTQAATGA